MLKLPSAIFSIPASRNSRENDRVRLVSSDLLPREIFPPFGRLLRSLVELSEMAKDEHLRLELRDQIKRVQTSLNNLSMLLS